MGVELRALTGPNIASHVDALARLRIAVFREYPYLYEGDAAYEAKYRANYAEHDLGQVLEPQLTGSVSIALSVCRRGADESSRRGRCQDAGTGVRLCAGIPVFVTGND